MARVHASGWLLWLGALLAPPAFAQEEAPAEPAPVEPAPEVQRLVEEAARAEATEIKSEEAKLSERVRAILAAVDDFAGMRAEVEAGIVVLSGVAPSPQAVQRASSTVEQLDGVLLVVDDVEIPRDLSTRLAESWSGVVEELRELVAALPVLGAAAAILVAFWLLARFLRDATFLYRFARERAFLQTLLRQTVHAAVLIAGVITALRFLGAGTVIGTILGAAGVLGIALGFAFRNIIENYLAGVLLAIRQPFRARDVVSIDGEVGTVLRVTSSETMLMDADGNHLRLPNAMIFNGKVLNYTRNPLRRFTVKVGVANDVDLEHAQDLGVETLARMKGVIDDPAPSARVTALGDSTVLLEVYGWVDQRAAGYLKVASEAHRLIKAAFDEAGIDMPPPEYHVSLENVEPAPPAAARPRPPAARGAAPEQADVSPQSDIDEQVAEEIARSEEENLLAES